MDILAVDVSEGNCSPWDADWIDKMAFGLGIAGLSPAPLMVTACAIPKRADSRKPALNKKCFIILVFDFFLWK